MLILLVFVYTWVATVLQWMHKLPSQLHKLLPLLRQINDQPSCSLNHLPKTIMWWLLGSLFALQFALLCWSLKLQLSHKCKKVSRDMQKFLSQSCGVNVVFTTCSHQWLLCSLHQIALAGGTNQLNEIISRRNMNVTRSPNCLLAKAFLHFMLCFLFQFFLLMASRFLETKYVRTRAIGFIMVFRSSNFSVTKQYLIRACSYLISMTKHKHTYLEAVTCVTALLLLFFDSCSFTPNVEHPTLWG